MKTNNTYTWNLEKWYRWTYFQGRIRNTDIENRLVDTVWGRRGWDELREQHWHTYTTMGKTASGKLLCNTGSPAWCSWWPRGEEWRRGRSKAQEGGDYTHTHTHTHIYIYYGWFILLYGRNQHNIVKQLSSNLNIFLCKRGKKRNNRYKQSSRDSHKQKWVLTAFRGETSLINSEFLSESLKGLYLRNKEIRTTLDF